MLGSETTLFWLHEMDIDCGYFVNWGVDEGEGEGVV